MRKKNEKRLRNNKKKSDLSSRRHFRFVLEEKPTSRETFFTYNVHLFLLISITPAESVISEVIHKKFTMMSQILSALKISLFYIKNNREIVITTKRKKEEKKAMSKADLGNVRPAEHLNVATFEVF